MVLGARVRVMKNNLTHHFHSPFFPSKYFLITELSQKPYHRKVATQSPAPDNRYNIFI